MRIVSIGGGPAGLYVAILLKKANPAHRISVLERNRPDDTFGFGVVFSDATLGAFAAADLESHDAIRARFARWDDLDIHCGGAVVTSRDLASMISGSLTEGAVYARLKYNDKHPELNQDLPFMTAQDRYTQPIEGLKRLVVITSGGTASASELLINGLRPFMQVVLVGDTTYGKPYGFNPRNDCGTTYNAVNFEVVNSQNAGGYSNGMPADCAAADDLDHQLGDTQERRLKEALNYIATGHCSAQAPQGASLVKKPPPRTFGETTPPQMFY